jgi:hypothetical protein
MGRAADRLLRRRSAADRVSGDRGADQSRDRHWVVDASGGYRDLLRKKAAIDGLGVPVTLME